jgi:hypothetical protein
MKQRRVGVVPPQCVFDASSTLVMLLSTLVMIWMASRVHITPTRSRAPATSTPRKWSFRMSHARTSMAPSPGQAGWRNYDCTYTAFSADWYVRFLERKSTCKLAATSGLTQERFDRLNCMSTDEYASAIAANNVDLTDLKARGTKMITWHGTVDGLIPYDGHCRPPQSSVGLGTQMPRTTTGSSLLLDTDTAVADRAPMRTAGSEALINCPGGSRTVQRLSFCLKLALVRDQARYGYQDGQIMYVPQDADSHRWVLNRKTPRQLNVSR